ncbi:MBL fold metallo-hydrolase [Syntrophomonas palmitatica]|uniref:MBL fold metallo-hydrolase n=1 Tax=Syntrophomonas palmitatica TaxID=402877 RepID=UPI0006D0F0E0|nr:MBL fold metallo-hydrolase [Syntrophomonas palmitatica]
MKKAVKICPHIYQVGGSTLSASEDCCVYLIENEGEGVLIDAGAGKGSQRILDNIKSLGLSLQAVKYIILTHGHIDHVGGLKYLQEQTGAQVVCHHLELPAIQDGEPKLTAAALYGMKYDGVNVDIVLHGDDGVHLGNLQIYCPHTPGHTVGGISPYIDIAGQRILFGQDIHGPFSSQWGSDMKQWRDSMRKLLALEADILCEGHFGIYQPAAEVKRYIEGYLRQYIR